MPALDLLRRICENEPKSVRASEGITRPETGSRNTVRVSMGDLRVDYSQGTTEESLRSLQKCRAFPRRYSESLDCRPVLAQRQSWWYRTRTFVRRHPGATLSTSVAALRPLSPWVRFSWPGVSPEKNVTMRCNSETRGVFGSNDGQ